MPFEQYMLMSLIEPRTLSIGSAIEDLWANPPAEFYSAAKASEIGALFGEKRLNTWNIPKRTRFTAIKPLIMCVAESIFSLSMIGKNFCLCLTEI